MKDDTELPHTPRRGIRKCEIDICPDAPKKKRFFESRISKWKSSQTLGFDLVSCKDSEEGELIVISQKLAGHSINAIVLKPDKAIKLARDILNSSESYNIKRFKEHMIYIYIELMKPVVDHVKKSLCEGCLEDYPSQLDHYCLTTEPEYILEDSFYKLTYMVDEAEANRLCNDRLFKLSGQFYLSKRELLADQKWIEILKEQMLKTIIVV